MQQQRKSTIALLAFAIALAACQDTTTAPINAPEVPDQAPTPTAARVQEGYETQGPLARGWIMSRGGVPMEIVYEVQGTDAVWQGNIIIGRNGTIARSRAELIARMELVVSSGVAQPGVYIDGAGFRWPGGVIPFTIDGGLDNTERVTDAIAMVEQGTAGITLVPRTSETDYVTFRDASGCSSEIGRIGGQQFINLGDNCGTGNAAHEIIHALGLFHEHTRCDRDSFVEILFANIEAGREHNFTLQCDDASDHDAYDEGSIMHYSPGAFSNGNGNTINSLRGRNADMGQRDSLGPTDVSTLNFLYGDNNEAPVADIAPLAASYPEGSSVAFDGSGSSDADDAVLEYLWDFGDGSCSSAPLPAECTSVSPSHTYADNGNYTVTLTVSDGFLDDDAQATAVIVNVAPVVNAGSDATRDEGSLFSQSGSFTDPGADTWTATVNYGDGSGTQALALVDKTFQLSHTYVDNGNYTVTVQVTDDDAGMGSDLVEVTVNNVAPTVTVGPDATLTSGETFEFTGGFSDPGIIDHPWSWVIDWGTPPTTTGSTNDQGAPIMASRQVCAAGAYEVTLTVTDKDGGAGDNSLTLNVLYKTVEIEIDPAPLNRTKKGLLAVTLLSSPTFDATAVNIPSITLGNELATDTPVAKRTNGSYQATVQDVNGDGLPDLLLKFDVPTLRANGDLPDGTTELALRGFQSDACTNFRGTDSILIVR